MRKRVLGKGAKRQTPDLVTSFELSLQRQSQVSGSLSHTALPQAEESQVQLISVTHHNYRPLRALAAHGRSVRLLGGGLCHKVRLGPQRGS